ncbi:DUF3857 domain-containing protein [Flavobacterium chungangense]|uniref:DUF3857 domain-containing protein n=1 Tax=Flavobacterium chungangense TaxID=554283 RepID=A0A6V6Z2E0_9FLAO|nr:DUF3857 domain-containing protein [Flavobacterium chungangense]CAD0005960.1 hypothetical protein FLACHUCJ7_02590 [Flavobacterium chungangense]
MKKYIVLFLFSFQLYSQEKSKIVYSNETVVINSGNALEVETFVNESRAISKSKNTHEYAIRIPFDSFSEISNIKGSTYITKTNKRIDLSSYSIATIDAENENIYKSDNKYKYFVMPKVEDNSLIEFSYKTKLKQPRFLSSFRFQNPIKTQTAKLQIRCNSSTEIGYKLFGNYQEKIAFSKTKEGNFDIYTWEANDIPEFEGEEDMPSPLYFMPHIIFYIKSYEIQGKKEELLGTPEKLYQWYYSITKDINKTDQTALENKTLELVKDKNSDLEKAKAIYQWVQQNVHYVAFEDGMGGFIPREASDIFQKLYGDCKDMANLLNEMFRYAQLNSNLTWIGTRHKPYTYADVPTPQVDNHMITNVVIDGKSYFMDATDKFCPFPFPSTFIQGKEALIGKTEKEFKIEKIPEVGSGRNKTTILMKLNLENSSVVGDASVTVSGFKKSYLLNHLSAYNQKESEIWKDIITENNQKILLDIQELQKNDYQELPSKANFKLKLENGIKDVNGKLLLKPVLLFPLKESLIDIEKRKLSIENDFAYVYEIQYEYQLPLDYKVEFMPENSKTENDLGSFDMQYKLLKNNIIVTQKIESKKLLLDNKDFILWNSFIKTLTKHYNQSIILSK